MPVAIKEKDVVNLAIAAFHTRGADWHPLDHEPCSGWFLPQQAGDFTCRDVTFNRVILDDRGVALAQSRRNPILRVYRL